MHEEWIVQLDRVDNHRHVVTTHDVIRITQKHHQVKLSESVPLVKIAEKNLFEKVLGRTLS